MIFHDRLGNFVIDRPNHGRCKFFRGEAVTAADYSGHDGERRGTVGYALDECGHDIQIKRFARCARLFRTVENGNAACRGRQSLDEGGSVKRTVETHLEQAKLIAALVQIMDGFFHRFRAGAHNDNNALRVGGADVVEQTIAATRQISQFIHRLLDDARARLVKRVHGFTRLEVNIWVLGSATHHGFVGRKRSIAMGFNQVVVDHCPHF